MRSRGARPDRAIYDPPDRIYHQRLCLMKKWLPWISVGVCAAGVLSTLRRKAEPGFDTRAFGQLPILLNGRIQPLDSAARNSLLQIRTKQTVPLEHGDKLSAIEWLLEVTMKPDLADERKVFRIDNL